METNVLVKNALDSAGITALNDMQTAALAAIESQPDTLLLAPTGSGKTLAFLLPALLRMRSDLGGVQCLVLSPTRELAIQIEKMWQQLSTGFKVNTCYGGHAMQTEINNLSQPPALLIGTPGRVLDHLERQSLSLDKVSMLVLDEFDKSLSMGFQEQMAAIVKQLPALQKKVLVSATNKLVIPAFMGIEAAHLLDFTAEPQMANDGLALRAVLAPYPDKDRVLLRLLARIGPSATLIFCNTRDVAEHVHRVLQSADAPSAFFHGGMEQIDREKTLIRFRNGSTLYLAASDLAARGLDIPDVRQVIHYELPPRKDDFIHRNGRTARMFAEGTAYVLLQSRSHLPPYLPQDTEWTELPTTHAQLPGAQWVTLYISGGKKDKISRADILGFMCQKGGLNKEEVGRIELLDNMSFVAVPIPQAQALLRKVESEKMKGKKYKIGIAR